MLKLLQQEVGIDKKHRMECEACTQAKRAESGGNGKTLSLGETVCIYHSTTVPSSCVSAEHIPFGSRSDKLRLHVGEI